MIFGFWKDPTGRLYLTVKVYISNLLSVYIIYKTSYALNEVILFGFLHFMKILGSSRVVRRCDDDAHPSE